MSLTGSFERPEAPQAANVDSVVYTQCVCLCEVAPVSRRTDRLTDGRLAGRRSGGSSDGIGALHRICPAFSRAVGFSTTPSIYHGCRADAHTLELVGRVPPPPPVCRTWIIQPPPPPSLRLCCSLPAALVQPSRTSPGPTARLAALPANPASHAGDGEISAPPTDKISSTHRLDPYTGYTAPPPSE